MCQVQELVKLRSCWNSSSVGTRDMLLGGNLLVSRLLVGKLLVSRLLAGNLLSGQSY